MKQLIKMIWKILTSQSTWFNDWLVMAQKFSTKFRGAENTRRTFSSAPDTNWNRLIIAKHFRSYPCIWGLAISCHVTWLLKTVQIKVTKFQKPNSFQQAKYRIQICYGIPNIEQNHAYYIQSFLWMLTPWFFFFQEWRTLCSGGLLAVLSRAYAISGFLDKHHLNILFQFLTCLFIFLTVFFRVGKMHFFHI